MKEQTQFNTMAKELNISIKDIVTQCDYSERTAYDMFHGHGKKLPRAFKLAVYVWKEIKRITKIENTKKDHVLINLTDHLEAVLMSGQRNLYTHEFGMLRTCKELGFGSSVSVEKLQELGEVEREKIKEISDQKKEEELVDHNIKVVSNFIDHCKKETGLEVSESSFISFF